ncbi:DUF4296 domain-containing protein [Ulvibacterium sp.]|uniref:DUF4296 domain-containing protein n=1 Tax=Ulvibacterium sp. TaxID=2665914 RepID=UPI0026346729|nr:DUF4296 domain-containing protein [Ulvibacterium sp.]
MGRILFFGLIGLLVACGEQLMEKPKDLIPKDQMVAILKDLAVINAAKNTNISILKEHNIEPTDYIFKKYNIDSARFVQSDTYYASLPSEYEAIYEEVEANLEKEKKALQEANKISDSLKAVEMEKKRGSKKKKSKKVKDSLP